MKAAMNEMYGAPEGEKFFSLMDYFREEARQKAQQEGLQKGLQEGEEKGRQEERSLWTQKVKAAHKQGLSADQIVDMLLKN